MQKDQIYQILVNLTNYKIPDKTTIFKVIQQSIIYHNDMQNCVDLEITSPELQLYAIGDLHGQFEDLIQILKIIDEKDPNNPKQLLFLGDMIDRGLRSLETLLYILCMQLLWPNRIIILRGNHETEKISRYYGFYDECSRKGNQTCYLCSLQLFQTLPVACSIFFNCKQDQSQLQTTNLTPPSIQKPEFPQYFNDKFFVTNNQKSLLCSHDSPATKHFTNVSFQQMVKPICLSFTQNYDFKKMHFNQNKQLSQTSFSYYKQEESPQVVTKQENETQSSFDAKFIPDESIFGEQSFNTSGTCSNIPDIKLQKIFACHGGISRRMRTIDDLLLKLRIFNDFEDTEDQGLIMDILWSDPDDQFDYYKESQRGCSWTFGTKAAQRFMQDNQYDLILRAHQMQMHGIGKQLNDHVVTVWSAANYEQRSGNIGAFVLLQNGELFNRQFGKKLYQEEKQPTVQIDYFL